jgi:hypothetical protein
VGQMFLVVHLPHTETARPFSTLRRHAANLDKSASRSNPPLELIERGAEKEATSLCLELPWFRWASHRE